MSWPVRHHTQTASRQSNIYIREAHTHAEQSEQIRFRFFSRACVCGQKLFLYTYRPSHIYTFGSQLCARSCVMNHCELVPETLTLFFLQSILLLQTLFYIYINIYSFFFYLTGRPRPLKCKKLIESQVIRVQMPCVSDLSLVHFCCCWKRLKITATARQ